MSDQEALLRTICAYPDADLPRLVYADWLEERGNQPRACFIRLQCEHNAETNPAEKERLRNAAIELYCQQPSLQKELCAELTKVNPHAAIECQSVQEQALIICSRCKRGFVESATLSAASALHPRASHPDNPATMDMTIDGINSSLLPLQTLEILSGYVMRPTAEQIARIQPSQWKKIHACAPPAVIRHLTHAESMRNVEVLSLNTYSYVISADNIRQICNKALMRPRQILMHAPRINPDALHYLIGSAFAREAIITLQSPGEDVLQGFTPDLVAQLQQHNEIVAKRRGERILPQHWMSSTPTQLAAPRTI